MSNTGKKGWLIFNEEGELIQVEIMDPKGWGEKISITEIVNKKLRKIERAIPAKTSIVETQTKEAAAVALRIIDAVRKAIREELIR